MSLSRKLSIALLAAFLVSIVYATFFSYMLYERLYVQIVETDMLETGKRLAAPYEGGTVQDSFIEEINDFGEKSQFEVFAVKNPRELSMCLPFEIDYDALISGEDREKLLAGLPVFNKGHVERLGRDVISVVVPLLDGKRLEGIIYLYYPLGNLTEMTSRFSAYWLAGAFLFLLIALTVGNRWLKRTIQPLIEMKNAARELSSGNLTARVGDYQGDEVGQLAKTFNEMAESVQKEDERRKEFLASVSHELRTPLSYIKGYMEAIHTGVVKQEDKEKYEHIILREANRMERLVDDLLDLAKFESQEFSLKKAPIPIAQTVEEVLDKVKQRMSENDIELERFLNYDLIAEADEERLVQMLVNILDNAIHYTPPGGKIMVSLTMEDDRFGVIAISDTGQGIPKEDLEKVTERFYRVNKARTRKEGGTGLGLAIVDRLVKLHGGTMKVESEVGKGTTVSIRLPVITADFP